MSGEDQPLRLVVFDWDGTLRDSIASIVGCAMAALEDLGLRATAEAVRSTVGLGLEDSVARWVDGIRPVDIDRVVERYRVRWVEDWHRRATLFSGVPDMLGELDRLGLLLAVGTGKSRTGLRRDFDALPEVEPLFAATRTADETAAKPSPEMLVQLMAELGTRPEETLMVGDTTHDLWMAANAGVPALAVLEGAMDRSELAPHAIDCLERVTELPGWLRLRNRYSGQYDQ